MPDVCPNCGYCPTCGHKKNPFKDHWGEYPPYPTPIIWSTSNELPKQRMTTGYMQTLVDNFVTCDGDPKQNI